MIPRGNDGEIAVWAQVSGKSIAEVGLPFENPSRRQQVAQDQQLKRLEMGWAMDKMLSGELYDSHEEELVLARQRCQRLVKRYNDHAVCDETSLAILDDLLGAKGDKCVVEMPFRCDYGCNIHLGDNVYINFNVSLLDDAEIRIGNNVMIAPNVQLYTTLHPLEPHRRSSHAVYGKPITIGDDVWLCGGAIILPGVSIGNGAVVGAGSVVTKDVPSMCVYAGNPAKFIKKVDSTEE
ncbi:hypothetical protein BBJ28_00021923 [Nothophytophthora sp. Chile5]|nr:hypothetical protein BBJ28_00021923 [Nothophytophthora sp. Chile5]